MKSLNFLSGVGLVIIFCFLAVSVYWLFIQPDIIAINNVDNIQVGKATYSPGERITYTINYCKSRKGVEIVTRALTDTFHIAYPTINVDLPVGCHEIVRSDLVIPNFVIPDGHKYRIEGTSFMRINPLRTQYVYWMTEEFDVQ